MYKHFKVNLTVDFYVPVDDYRSATIHQLKDAISKNINGWQYHNADIKIKPLKKFYNDIGLSTSGKNIVYKDDLQRVDGIFLYWQFYGQVVDIL